MTGVVAIIARDRRADVSESEIDELASVHELLRGPRIRSSPVGSAEVRAIVLGPPLHDGLPPVSEDGSGSWAALIGAIRERDGSPLDARLDSLDGHFGLVRYRADERKVEVATDPRAFQPMYVAERDGKAYVCDSALVLARHLGSKPSRLGLNTFLRTGYHFGRQTNWEGIERLEPGAYTSFANGRREEGIYWRPAVDRDAARLPLDRAVDHCLDVALDTCERWLAGRPRMWVDLTGGFDGRLLSLLLARLGIAFDTDTRGDYTGDRAIARKVADVTGWTWWDLTVPDDWSRRLAELLPGAVAWSDAHLDPFELAWVLWAHQQLSARHPWLLYGGGGEHLRGYCWRQEFPLAGKTTRVNFDNWVDLRLIHPVNTSVFARDPTPEVRQDVLARMMAWREPYADELNTTQLDWLFSYKMTGHFGIYRSADAMTIRSEVPLYSKRMYETAISINYRLRRSHRLERHMIWRLDPRVAAVETDSGGPSEPWRLNNLHRFVPYYTQYTRRAVNKVAQKTFGRSVFRRDETGDWWCPPDARRGVLHLLSGNGRPSADSLRSAPLYDRAALDDLFRRAERDDFTDTGLLGRMTAVELSLRAADAAIDG
jgi:hypothetical protein